MRRPAPRKPRKQTTDRATIVRQLAGALPRPSAIGRGRVTEWLKGLARTADGRALASVAGEHRKLGDLLAGIAETAPYLWDLIARAPVFY